MGLAFAECARLGQRRGRNWHNEQRPSFQGPSPIPMSRVMQAKKSRSIIRAEEVPTVFDDVRSENLAEIANLPPGADMKAWGEGIREAALVFVRDVRTPTDNELSREIAGL